MEGVGEGGGLQRDEAARHGGAEQQRLARRGQGGQDPAQVGLKAGLQEAVGLVQHQVARPREARREAGVRVQEALRRCCAA